ncbi:MAG: cyclic di-AMP binding protein CbpA [Atopostipes suicloacalis]|nr:cyclic di-AMP binding protein CbpA [Atopostipes suicloacalis]MDN6731365.1 cyclic di-AMP binding protein CbpA [Atopostipes suicloacalis]
MLIKELSLAKTKVRTVPETVSLEEALKLLEDYGYRCVPIVDESGKIYRGNIYRMHIYKHKSEGKDMSLPVTHLLKNATKFVHTYSSFYSIFFMIKDLPYITVLDENDHFYGILTHSALINLLEQSWKINAGSYVITVAAAGEKGDIAAITKIINRYTDIMSLITLEGDTPIKRAIITLAPNVSKSDLDKMSNQLDRRGYRVVQVENLDELE